MSVSGVLGLLLLSAAATGGEASQPPSGPYFGQAPPGDMPAVFAPGVISREGRFEQFLLFSPDGQALSFGLTDSTWNEFSLQYMTMSDGRWTEPRPAPFQGSNPVALTVAFSFDLRTAFIASGRRSVGLVDIWASRRDDDGWSEPTRLGPPVSSEGNEFEVAVSRNGTLYFSSNREGGLGDLDIYRAPPVDGGYPAVENLGPPINTGSGDDLPYIAPDESYLIFASDRPGTLGYRDLYISFQIDGAWTEPENLGAPINSEYWDIYPSLSPDGRYLFFTRRESWQATEDSDIYWVDAGFIDRLRERSGR